MVTKREPSGGGYLLWNTIFRKGIVMKKGLLLISFLMSFFLFAGSSYGQIEEVKLRVDGLACPFCAWGLEKKVMQMEGVTSYDADLKTGEVYIGLQKDVHIELERFRKAVKEAGFTLRQISLKAKGVVEKSQSRFVLVVGGSHEKLLLFETEAMAQEYHRGLAPKALGEQLEKKLTSLVVQEKTVQIVGTVHEHAGLPAGLSVERLEVLE